jgi:predicted nucleic acid-binding protein
MGWCFEDERSTLGETLLEKVKCKEMGGVVPSLWRLEIVNVIVVAERRKRITTAESIHFLDLLLNLPVVVDESTPDLKDLLLLSRTYNLSAYDAVYLELALREQIPLATLDKKLREAAENARIPLMDANFEIYTC